jgi:hypothetical protein
VGAHVPTAITERRLEWSVALDNCAGVVGNSTCHPRETGRLIHARDVVMFQDLLRVREIDALADGSGCGLIDHWL